MLNKNLLDEVNKNGMYLYEHFMNNSSSTQMMGFIITDETHTIIIDGGTGSDAENLLNILSLCGKKIDGWFFTHPHIDHIGAFMKIAKEKLMPLPEIFLNFPPPEFVKNHTSRNQNEYKTLVAFNELCPSFTKIKKGDVFNFGNITLEVLRTFNPEITSDTVNSSSAVFKVSDKKSLLILGDLSKASGYELMNMFSQNQLKCDYTQLSHHGQNGVDFKFYEVLNGCIIMIRVRDLIQVFLILYVLESGWTP